MEHLEAVLEAYCSHPDFVKKVVEKCCQQLSTPNSKLNIHEAAWELVARAKEKARQLGLAVVISVVDVAGHTVMTYRMEDALLVSTDMAYKKAYTAVGMRVSSKDLGPLTQPGQWLYGLETMTDNKVVSLAGGIPIFDGDRLVGGIGISGGSEREDQLIAEYALHRM